MRAGDLRELVTLEVRSSAQDEAGQQIPTWTGYISQVRARVETLSVREFIAAQGSNVQATHRVTVRYDPRLEDPIRAGALRVIFRGRVFDVRGAANVDERNREIWLLCTEGLTQG